MQRVLACALVTVALFTVGTPAKADENPRLMLEDVAALTPKADMAWLRRIAPEAVAATSALMPHSGETLMVKVSVVSLASAENRDGAGANCEVAVTAHTRKGALVASAHGRAHADGARGSVSRVERAATRSAVQAALAMLPQSL
jgi:hypothetical protein